MSAVEEVAAALATAQEASVSEGGSVDASSVAVQVASDSGSDSDDEKEDEPTYEMSARRVSPPPHEVLQHMRLGDPKSGVALKAWTSYTAKQPFKLSDWRSRAPPKMKQLKGTRKDRLRGAQMHVDQFTTPQGTHALLLARYRKLMASPAICSKCAEPEKKRPEMSIVLCPGCMHEVCANQACLGCVMCECSVNFTERTRAHDDAPLADAIHRARGLGELKAMMTAFREMDDGSLATQFVAGCAVRRVEKLRGSERQTLHFNEESLNDEEFSERLNALKAFVERIDRFRNDFVQRHPTACETCAAIEAEIEKTGSEEGVAQLSEKDAHKCAHCWMLHCAEPLCARYYNCSCGQMERAYIATVVGKRAKRLKNEEIGRQILEDLQRYREETRARDYEMMRPLKTPPAKRVAAAAAGTSRRKGRH
jgi:hypothetical protein